MKRIDTNRNLGREACHQASVDGALGQRALPGRALAWVLAVLAVFLCANARAQQVQATLSQDYTGVGQPVQLNVSVVGGRGAQVPPELKIDGLEARFAGKSEQTQVQMNNGRFSMTATSIYTYLVVPLRPGNFTIPAIQVTVEGRNYKTSPLTLRVGGSSGGVPVLPAIPVPQSQPQQNLPPSAPAIQTIPPGPSGQPQSSESKIAFGELLIPKATAYAGEVVPLEIRFYFDANYPVRLQDRPGFSGDGFTVLRVSKPAERQQEINGRIYNVVSFQTAITPAKSGMLEIPAATLETQIQMPAHQSRGADDFFGGLFGNMGENRQVTVSTRPAKLEVKPLPVDGRPEEFSGAIGQFSLQGTAAPKKAAAGDPISLNVTVSGRGNFDALSAPHLTDADGWRTYPPSEKFEASPSDPIGFNGEKDYEYMLLAREDRTGTPVAEFSYFDPAIEKYVTLKTSVIAVTAKGGSGTTPGPASVAAATPTPQPPSAPATAVPVAGSEDLLVTNFQPSSFQPFAASHEFLTANAVLAAAWCAALLFGVGRLVAGSNRAKASASRRETLKLLRQMEDPACDPVRFFDLAAQFVDARLAPGGSHPDTREMLESAALSEETKSSVSGILDQHDALKYSTRGAGAGPGADERRQIVAQLKKFDEELR